MKSRNLTLCGRILTALLMLFSVTACSDDKEEDVTVTFPEKQTIVGNASDSEFYDLTFNAVADWTLTSNAIWCYFVPQQAADQADASVSKQRTLSGKAGKQTVQIGISDEGQNSGKEDVATITIKMNGQEQVLAEVTRSTKERGLKLYKKNTADNGSESWTEIGKDEAIVAGYDKYITYKVTADFDFVASDIPEWLQVEGNAIIGKANEEVEFGIQAKEDDPKYYQNANNGEIVFSDEKTQAAVSTYKVTYDGMDADAIVIERNGLPDWNWKVSMDGKTFKNEGGMGSNSETITRQNSLDGWSIIARNNDYEMVYVEKTEQMGFIWFRTNPAVDDDVVDWIHVNKNEKDETKITLTVDAAEEEREGYVLVFPKAVYDEMKKGDPYEYLIDSEENDVKYTFRQNNLLLNFKQEEQAQPGEEVRIIKMAGPDYPNQVTLGGKDEINAAITVEGSKFTDVLKDLYSVNEDDMYSINAEDCQSVRIYVPFEIKAPEDGEEKYDIKQVFAVSFDMSSFDIKDLDEGPDGVISCPMGDDGDKNYKNAVDLSGVEDTKNPIAIVIRQDMEENGMVNKYVIVVLPIKE